MLAFNKKAKTALCVLLFLLIAAAGVIVERFEKDMFITETVAVDDSAQYIPDGDGISNGKININTADAAELQVLKGIGSTLSERITEYRALHGEFGTIEEIMKVPGINEKKFQDFKDDICTE